MTASLMEEKFLASLVFFRSFSELYQKAIKDAECKPGEDQSSEAWVLDEREEEEEEEEADKRPKRDSITEADAAEVQVEGDGAEEHQGPSERSVADLLLLPPSLPLLRATSLQDQTSNQDQEGSQLTRSFSLERHSSYSDTTSEG